MERNPATRRGVPSHESAGGPHPDRDRVGGDRLSNSNTFKLLVTLDLSRSQWQRSRQAWGLGLHAAFSNDAGPRFAPRVHWRMPLGSGPTFLQAAAGVYLLAFDREMNGTPLARLDLPGHLLEVEWGSNEVGSFFASAEFLPIGLYEDSLGCLSDCTEGATPISSTSITNYSLGMKFGGKEGRVTAVVALITAVLYTAAELASWQ